MKVDLGRDAFTISYDPARVDVDTIMRRIRGLGYEPDRAVAATDEAPVAACDSGAVPASVRDAQVRARTKNRLTLVDFYAAWCAPCKVLETEVLGDPRVQEVLGEYEFVKLDTDRFVDPSDCYNVVGLPTLLVLDDGGAEIYRVEGMVDAEELARTLTQLAGEYR